MGLKSSSPTSSRPFLSLTQRFYRAVGWAGIVLTLFLSMLACIEMWGRGRELNPDLPLSYLLLTVVLMFFACVFVGLFFSGMAFLISASLHTASQFMENSRAQTDLLRRIVREQSDFDSVSRIAEEDRPQTQNLHRLANEQKDMQTR